MSKMKEMMSDWKYVKICLYIVFTATLLYIVYRIIANFSHVIESVSSALGSMASAFTPLIIGLILAYLISPMVDFIDNKIMSKVFFRMPSDPIKLEKRIGIRRTFSILITFLIIIVLFSLIIYAFAFLIVGDLVFTSLQSMIDSIIDYFLKYETVFKGWVLTLPHNGIEDQLQGLANNAVEWVSNNFSTAAIINFITNLGSSILNMVLGIVVSIYLIKDKDFFIRLWRKFLHLVLPMKANAAVTEILCDIDTVVGQFLRGQLLDALIIAVLTSIGFSIIGLDFAVFLGCFAGLANVIPYFGPFISAIPAAIVGLMTGGVTQALLAVLVLLIIQQIDSNIIYPKVVGSSTGLHPLFILVSVTVGGYYAGILGMVLAVPVAAIIKVFIMKKVSSL